jgi:hypothetical protein
VRSERGFATAENVVAAAFALWFFAALANLIVMQYTLGVATVALDEGARQGARSLDPVTACQDRAASTFVSVDGGSVISSNLRCWVDGVWVVARVDGTLDGWAPPIPDLSFTREARAPREDLEP